MIRNQRQLDKGEIFFLSKRLPQLSEDAMRYVRNPFDYTISYQKWGKRAEKTNTYWCCSCGEEYRKDELTDLRLNPEWKPHTFYYRTHLATCPHCGKTMKIEKSWCRHRHFQDVVGVHAIVGEWAVDRYFNCEVFCKPSEKESVIVNEIGQVWSKGEGRRYPFFVHRGGLFYSKYWKADTEMRFINDIPNDAETREWWGGTDTYDYPADFSLEKELQMRGIDANNLHGMPLMDILSCMAYTPYFETLWKAGEYEMAKFFKKSLPNYWAQIKIARRQGYVIEDLTKWRDMIDMLRNLRDINSPKYICPANLERAHERAIVLKNRQRHLGELERNKIYDKALRQRIAKFLDMDIRNEHVQIIVLPNVKAFMDETDHLGHCVYTCGYYKKESSLILSARDIGNVNKRWETIEVDLNNFTILQCYGYKDKFTERHKEIVSLMKDNMWQVRERMKMVA